MNKRKIWGSGRNEKVIRANCHEELLCKMQSVVAEGHKLIGSFYVACGYYYQNYWKKNERTGKGSKN